MGRLQRIHLAPLLSALALLALGCGAISRATVYPRYFSRFAPCPEAEAAKAAIVRQNGLRYIEAKVREPLGLVIFYHGNGNGACERSELIERVNSLNCDLVLAEYPGYGGEGEVGEAAILADALKIHDAVAATRKNLPLVLYGESLGTGVATWVARERGADGLILQSPYTSVVDAGAKCYWFLPTRSVLTEHFPAAEWAPSVAAPVLAFYGTADWVIDPSISVMQLHHFKGPVTVEVIQGAGHSQVMTREEGRYFAALGRFVRGVIQCP